MRRAAKSQRLRHTRGLISYRSIVLNIFFFFLAAPCSLWDFPDQGIDPAFPALKAQSLNHSTAREVWSLTFSEATDHHGEKKKKYMMKGLDSLPGTNHTQEKVCGRGESLHRSPEIIITFFFNWLHPKTKCFFFL